MATRKKAEPVNEAAQAADDSGIYLDPELAKLRDEEAKRLDAIKVEERAEPTIDPELKRLRDEEAKREPKQIG